MGAEPPLSTVVLAAGSVADDLSFVALADIARLLGRHGSSYRVIGGLMVSVLVARWGLGANLYRETLDVDVGLPPLVAGERALVKRLSDLGYEQRSGDRFTRVVHDIPVETDGGPREAAIDILVPAYTSRPRRNRRVGDHLVVTEAPGLGTALRRPPVIMSLELRRLNSEVLLVELAFPDEVSALVLKGLATTVRLKDTDVVDVWRCLEVLYAAQTGIGAFDDGLA